MDFPFKELTPEKQEELINDIAKKIVDHGMETPAIIFLDSFKPMSYIGTQMGLVYGAMILPLLGHWGYDLLALAEKKENVERLLQTIEALVKEKDKESKRTKEEQKKTQPKKKKGVILRLFRR